MPATGPDFISLQTRDLHRAAHLPGDSLSQRHTNSHARY